MLEPHRNWNSSEKSDNDAFERLNHLLEMSHMTEEKACIVESIVKPSENTSRRNNCMESSENFARKNGQQPQKTAQMCDDRNPSHTNQAISFKSWQSKGGAPTMQYPSVENERLTKDVKNSNTDRGEGTKQV